MNNRIKTDDFNYDLPPQKIASYPVAKRDESKLMVVKRRSFESPEISHAKFLDIIDYLNEGDCLVINQTKVIKARFIGFKDTGAKIEVLLLKPLGEKLFEAMIKPAKRVSEGTIISVLPEDGKPGEPLKIQVVKSDDDIIKQVRILNADSLDCIEKFGKIPLPPYIEREAELSDEKRYQTVYSKVKGSVAAPTAGLHFTDELISKIQNKGIKIARILLHVGIGTFRPVNCDDISDHTMHSEYFEISEEASNIINSTKKNGGRVICVGTTSVRTLEGAKCIQNASPGTSGKKSSDLKACSGETNIFIYPGYEFKLTDGIITNFHLPKSTLLMLVSAFLGLDNTLNAYDIALKSDYRFFSYGDAMLII